MARRTKLAAVFGHPAYLYGHLRYTQRFEIVSNPLEQGIRHELEALQWAPGRIRVEFDSKDEPRVRRDYQSNQDSFRMVRDRWVYVFVFDGTTRRTAWFLELFVDNDFAYHLNPAREKSERLSWSPEDGSEAVDLGHELPSAATGRKWFVGLIGTPFRLSDACIDALENDDKIFRLIPPIDLSDDKQVQRVTSGPPGHVTASIEHLALPVVLPFDVGRQLSIDIDRARSKRANLQGVDGEFDKASPGQVVEAEQYVFSRSLRDLIDHPKMTIDFSDDFGEGKEQEMRSFVKEHERKIERLEFLAEQTGVDLARWIDRELVQILLDGAEPTDGAKLLEPLGEITAGLSQTSAGLACLAKYSQRSKDGTFLHRLFSGHAPLSPLDRVVAEKSLKSFVGIFATFHKAKIAHLEIAVETILQEVRRVLSPMAPEVTFGDLEVRSVFIKGLATDPELVPKSRGAKSVLIRVKAIHPKIEFLQSFGKAVGGVQLALTFFDTINFAVAVKAYFDADSKQVEETREKGLAAAAASANLLATVLNKTFDAVGRKSIALGVRVAVRGLGVVAAIHAIYAMGKDAQEAMNRGDYDAAVTRLAAGSLTVTGALLSFGATVADASALGWIGIAVGVVGGIFHVVYLYVKDTDLETLVVASGYGDLLRESNERPKWSPVPLPQLAADWELQSRALGALQRQFAVGYGNRASSPTRKVTPFFEARVFVGHIDDSTRFEVEWVWATTLLDTEGRELQTWKLFTDEEEETRQYGPILQVTGSGQPFFDIEIPEKAWREAGLDPVKSGGGFSHLTIRVRKLYQQGTSELQIPPDGPVEVIIQEGNRSPEVAGLEPKSSLA